MSTFYSNTRPEVALSEATTLPQRYYTDSDWFQREMEAIHFDMWLCAGRANQIPSAGDYFVRDIANASVIIVRDEQGGIRAFHNVCRHRGTLLCKDDHGRFAGRIQYQYHAWTYKLDGSLATAPPQPTYLGGRMEMPDGVKSLTMDGTAGRCSLLGLGSDDQRHVYYYCLLPNFFLNLHPDYMLTFTMWPHAFDKTEIVCEWHFHSDEIRKPGFNPQDAIEFWDITNKQDWELSDLAQRGISSKGYQPGPYSNREELLFALDRFVLGRVKRD